MANPVQGFNPALLPPAHVATSRDNRAHPVDIQATQSLPLHQQGQNVTMVAVPPSYMNPTRETNFNSPPNWSQGMGQGQIGITVEPPTETEVAKGHNKEDIDIDSASEVSDAPTVPHFNISFLFEKTFREHPGVDGVNCSRNCTPRLYKCTLNVTYNIFLILFGFILATIWGVLNGLVAFFQTWCMSPLLRISSVLVKGFLPIILDPVSLILKAAHDACKATSPGSMIGGAMQKVSGLAG